MRIGILIDRLNVGGVEKIAIEQVRALRKLGEDAHLVVLREKAVVANAFPELLRDTPVIYLDKRLPRFLRLSFRFPVFHFFSSFHISYALFLPFVVERNEFDYLIVHGTYTCFTAGTIKKTRKIRFSAFVWDPISYILVRVYAKKFLAPVMWILKRTAYLIDKSLISSMDNVLVGGAAHNDFIKKISARKNIEIIYPSVHPLQKLTRKEDYILMVTAWKRGKNPEYIFEILRSLPDVHVKMVGKWIEPGYKAEFEEAARQHNFDTQIEVVGEVSEIELASYYSRARVLLQVNDDRGFGMSALEAAGSGTTFIIPRGQGVCDLFKDGDDGFYTAEKDTKTIVRLLNMLIADKKLADAMGKRAWRKVNNNYSWEKHATKLEQVIDRTLHS